MSGRSCSPFFRFICLPAGLYISLPASSPPAGTYAFLPAHFFSCHKSSLVSLPSSRFAFNKSSENGSLNSGGILKFSDSKK